MTPRRAPARKTGALQLLLALLLVARCAPVDSHRAHSYNQSRRQLGGLQRGTATTASAAIGRRLLAPAGQPPTRGCGTQHNAGLAAEVRRLEAKVFGRPTAGLSPAELTAAMDSSAFPSTNITVPIHFHVIHYRGRISLTDTSGYNVTDRALSSQVAALTRDYKSAGIAFRRGTVTWWESSTWARDCEAAVYSIVPAVSRNPATALNVVLCDMKNLGLAMNLPGPGFDERSPAAVFVHYKSLPGGPWPAFDLGRTLTHEVGHYAGLDHVFEGGACSGAGDGVSDTAMQATHSEGCPVGKDSCPGTPGVDNIRNFMDYSDDDCMTLFTLGQIARMQAVLLQYRPTLVKVNTNVLKRRMAAQQ